VELPDTEVAAPVGGNTGLGLLAESFLKKPLGSLQACLSEDDRFCLAARVRDIPLLV
jgi:hypothetical protein